MEAHAAGDDEDTFVAKGSQSTAGGYVLRRIERLIERQRDDGDVGLRKRDLEGNKDSMIVAAGGIGRRWQPLIAQQFCNASGKRRIAGRGPDELVGVGGEAGIVEDEWRFSGRAGSEGRLFPMAADNKQGSWLFRK